MNYLNQFLELMQALNPRHDFSQEEAEFLKDNFVDLRAFIEGLGGDEKKSKPVNFEDVMNDEIFYYQEETYTKINNTQARVLNSRQEKDFLPLTEVNIYISREPGKKKA